MTFDLHHQHTEIILQQRETSEKQMGFSHGNSHSLHLLSNSSSAKTWLSTANRIFSSTTIHTTFMVQVLPNGKSLDFDYLKSRQRRCYTMNSASAAGNPGWSRTRPKLVCCEAWWLRGNKSSSNGLRVVLLSCYLSS